MKLKIICVALAVAAFVPVGQAQVAQHLSATKANEYALVYSLPKTMIDVTIEAEVTVKKPGEFYKYAPKYLNISNPITKESHSVKLLSAVLSTHGVIDTGQTYALQFKNGNPVVIDLDAAGIPLSINTEEIMQIGSPELPEPQAAQPTPLETEAARQVVSEEMLQSQSTAKRAELAAQAIFAIRQTRSELISGQAETMPPDGASLQLMLNNLQAQEDALMAMFVGTTSTYTQVQTYLIDPSAVESENDAKIVVARLSAVDGIVAADDLSGAPVYVNLKVDARGQMPENEKGETLPFPKNGVPYCIPGELTASVSFDGETVASKRLEIAQLGVTYGLAPNSFTDKKKAIFVIYDPRTGAISRQGPAIR